MDDLEAVGYKIEPVKKDVLDTRLWRIYYRKDGTPTRLPGDRDSMRSYLARGFSLTPPVAPSNGGSPKCSLCGFEAKNEFGLHSHMRKHKRESNKEKR